MCVCLHATSRANHAWQELLSRRFPYVLTLYVYVHVCMFACEANKQKARRETVRCYTPDVYVRQAERTGACELHCLFGGFSCMSNWCLFMLRFECSLVHISMWTDGLILLKACTSHVLQVLSLCMYKYAIKRADGVTFDLLAHISLWAWLSCLCMNVTACLRAYGCAQWWHDVWLCCLRAWWSSWGVCVWMGVCIRALCEPMAWKLTLQCLSSPFVFEYICVSAHVRVRVCLCINQSEQMLWLVFMPFPWYASTAAWALCQCACACACVCMCAPSWKPAIVYLSSGNLKGWLNTHCVVLDWVIILLQISRAEQAGRCEGAVCALRSEKRPGKNDEGHVRKKIALEKFSRTVQDVPKMKRWHMPISVLACREVWFIFHVCFP